MTDDLNSKAIIESAKAAQEVAKTGGKAIDTAEQFGKFISSYVAGPLEQAVGIVEDKLRYMRWERQIRLMEQANQIMAKLGVDAPNKPIPLKLAIPLFEAASLEDNDYLQDMWAKLLVNASISEREIELRRAHIDILERLSPVEALILEKIYAIPADELVRNAVITGHLPESVTVEEEDTPEKNLIAPSEEVVMALANLARLGCLTLPTTWNGGEIFTSVYPTVIGRSLFEACSLAGEEG